MTRKSHEMVLCQVRKESRRNHSIYKLFCLKFQAFTSILKHVQRVDCCKSNEWMSLSYQALLGDTIIRLISTKRNTLYLLIIIKLQLTFKLLQIMSLHLLTSPVNRWPLPPMRTQRLQNAPSTFSVVFIVLWAQGRNIHLPPESEFLAAVLCHFFLSTL